MSGKTRIKTLSALLLSAILLTGSGCGGGAVRRPTVDELDLSAKYRARGVMLFSFDCPDPSYNSAQGCCFDGENWVVAFNRFDTWGEECTLLCKFDRKGNFVKSSDGPLYLEHANNITYLPEQKAYYVTSCQGTITECWNGYTLVDRDTLEVKKKGRLEAPFFAMSYCPAKAAFASGRWAGETLDFWDAGLNLKGTKDVTPPGTLSQGVFAAPDAVWFVRSSMNGLHQEFRLYDWSGELINQILLDLDNDAESESVNIVDGVVYVTSNGGNRAPLYRVEFRVN
ncbi:MAG: hypothetical protein J6X34_09340 [Clostridia bacterium]|nr:hypothetical protein [Clostridia bacterium]